MGKILYSGDVHAKLSSLDTFQKYLATMLRLQKERLPDMVVIGGDLFDGHAIIRSEIMKEWVDYLEKSIIPHVLLVGNHDLIAPGAAIHAMAALKKHAKVVDKPYRMGDLLFLPYVHTQVEFEEMIDISNAGHPYDRCLVLFCHQSFDGSKYDNGFYVPDGINLDLVRQFKLVVSGHIHCDQQFANVWYPGSPYSMSFADVGLDKAVWMIDTDTDSRERIPTNLPKFLSVTLSVHEVLSFLETANNEDHYRLIVQGNRSEITALADQNAYKDLRKTLKISIQPNYLDIAVKEEKISDKITPEDMVKTYIEKVMITELDKNRLLDLSNKLLKGNML